MVYSSLFNKKFIIAYIEILTLSKNKKMRKLQWKEFRMNSKSQIKFNNMIFSLSINNVIMNNNVKYKK